MPTDPNGNYTLPPSYYAEAGQTIRTEQHNPPFEDVATGLSNRLDRQGRGSMLAALNMGTYRITNVGNGVADTDAATIGQVSNITPIGGVIDFAGASPPPNWLLCYGQAISRTDYADLFAVIGVTWGNGDGTTTFNVPDLRGVVTAGLDNMGGTDAGRLSGFWGALARTMGSLIGSASVTLATSQIPAHSHSVTGTAASAGAHTHTVSATGTAASAGNHQHQFALYTQGTTSAFIQGTSGPSPTATQLTSVAGAHTHDVSVSGTAANAGNHTHSVSGTAADTGGGNAHSNTQPTRMMNKIIRVM